MGSSRQVRHGLKLLARSPMIRGPRGRARAPSHGTTMGEARLSPRADRAQTAKPSTKRDAAQSNPWRAPRLIMSGTVAEAVVARARWLARIRLPSRAQWIAALATAIGYYA